MFCPLVDRRKKIHNFFLSLLFIFKLVHCYVHFRYKPSPEDVLLKAFLVLDQDGKGYLTQDELAKYMTEDGKYSDIT